MHLLDLELTNFRNYDRVKLDLCEGTNIFVGRNAQGKTNLLEAVHVLATGKSHRLNSDADLVRFSGDTFSIRGSLKSGEVLRNLRVSYSSDSGKEVILDGKRVHRASDLADVLSTVIFSPEDLDIAKGSPAVRRRFLDTTLFQISRAYRQDFLEYSRALSQRNSTLRQSRGSTTSAHASLDIWDEQLVNAGVRVVLARRRGLLDIEERAQKVYGTISGGEELLTVLYRPSVSGCSPEEIRDVFRSDLVRLRAENLMRGVTTVGPHRDDIELSLDGRNTRIYGSQGQQRSVVLSLKAAVLERVSECLGEPPILLLDDVMSELDERRRQYLLTVVSNGVQTLITTTSPDLGHVIEGNPRVFRIVCGELERCRVDGSTGWVSDQVGDTEARSQEGD